MLRKSRFRAEITWFRIGLSDTIVSQALILPAGAVGRMLSDQRIVRQSPRRRRFRRSGGQRGSGESKCRRGPYIRRGTTAGMAKQPQLDF